jgi:hypothetical protein
MNLYHSPSFEITSSHKTSFLLEVAEPALIISMLKNVWVLAAICFHPNNL